MAQVDQYFLGYRQAEQERLQRQAQELAHEARWLLDQINVRIGARAIEIGCGPQGCLDLLSERVGPTGSVVGVERSDEAVNLARRFAADHHLANVEVLRCDARATGLPRDTFDLATAWSSSTYRGRRRWWPRWWRWRDPGEWSPFTKPTGHLTSVTRRCPPGTACSLYW